jgi:hypothetical protein
MDPIGLYTIIYEPNTESRVCKGTRCSAFRLCLGPIVDAKNRGIHVALDEGAMVAIA